MEVEQGINQERAFWEKSSLLKKIVGFSRKIPDKLNPLWHIFWLAHNRGRAQAMANREMAQHISYVINGMSKSEKKLLTIQRNGSETITPQQSFLDFFNKKDLMGINPAKFIQGFIDLFTRNKDEWFGELKELKEIKIEDVNNFWSKFLVLIENHHISTQPKAQILKGKVNVGAVSFFQRIRRFFRVLLSGTGSID